LYKIATSQATGHRYFDAAALILDPFLNHVKAVITDPAKHLGQVPLPLILHSPGEVTTPRVIVPGHRDQASGFAIRDPVANARHGIGGVEHQ
jgi:hypothetical protein